MIGAVILGTMSGKALFSKYGKSIDTMDNEDVYFLQEGVYSSKDSLNNNTSEITPKLVVPSDDKYYVYVGISKDLETIKKIQKIYKDKGYSTYQKKIKVDNTEFLTNMDQYDILLDNTTKTNDILTIQDVVLSNYQELVRG